jgi:hypothetical protein
MIEIIPKIAGFPSDVATSLNISVGGFTLDTGTTTTYTTVNIFSSGGTPIDSATLLAPIEVFSDFINNAGGSGVTSFQNWVISELGFTRL